MRRVSWSLRTIAARRAVTSAMCCAQYGAQHMADVTSRLAAMVRGDQLSLRIAYDTIGVDPDEGRTKHIVVNYTYNGVPAQVTLRDGETLSLPGAGNWNGGPGGGNYGALT